MVKFGTIIDEVVKCNSVAAWKRLLHFPARCLRVPVRDRGGVSLASRIKSQIQDEADPVPIKVKHKTRSRHGQSDEDILQSLGRRVASKLEEGDIKGAVRLTCSEDRLAPFNSATFEALQNKHPVPHCDTVIPPPPSPCPLQIDLMSVAHAIRSFPNGSAGGPDLLRPQHLKDMLQVAGEDSRFLQSLASFCTLVMEGGVPDEVRPFFFGASLVALEKTSGGVRPIAVGCSLRRLIAKIAGQMVVEDMAALLSPKQLGYGVRGGAEAAVHAARRYLQDLPSGHVLLKLDFRNAFNSVRRDKMLEAVRDLAPEIYPLVHSAYSSPSSLLWCDKTINSAEGVQQGDPLGPLLFCLTLHRHCEQLRSPLCVMYLDDVSIGGPVEDVLHDLEIIQAVEELGLFLNNSKSEIICRDDAVRGAIIMALPGAMVVEPERACLLGSPLGDVASISASLDEKVHALSIMGARLSHLSAHDSLTLLRHSFAIPKLRYLLRTAPCFLSNSLEQYDSTLRSIVSSVTNTPLAQDENAWRQASLPVRLGGLGVRCAVQVAPSAYLASTAATADLVSILLPSTYKSIPVPSSGLAFAKWSEGHSCDPPTGADVVKEKSWDCIRAEATASTLLNGAKDDVERARLLAAMDKDSGAWLQALPISSVGLRMDDSTLRIAVGLRLGTTICVPHICQHCGAEVSARGTHGLSCKSSEGRYFRHAAINDIIHRTLTTAAIPSRLEPPGLSRSDGKRPDGMSLVPWSLGRPLVWDATCPDTFAASYRGLATSGAGSVAASAEEKKDGKYLHLAPTYLFHPVAIETSGAIGPRSRTFLRELGRRVHRQSGEANSTSYLLQRLSVAVQRGNAVAIMGCASACTG